MRIGTHKAAFMAFALVIFPFQKEDMAQEQRAKWQTTATVSADHIYLADLLAADANPQLRGAASRIDLGRAPELGSFRVFTERQLREAVGMALVLDVPEQVSVHRRGWPISPEQLTAALEEAKLPPVPVTLLAAAETRNANAILRVSAALPGRSRNLVLVRFVCRERYECAPFWGEIEVSEKWQQSLPAQNLAHRATHLTALVSPGRSAILICQEPGMELRLRVRPLGRAEMGESVRVYDSDTRRIFLARVKAEDLVTSDLREAR